MNTSLSDLISFAYGVHPKQVIGAPDWAATDKFDIDASQTAKARPATSNGRAWCRSCSPSASVSIHRDKKELSIYVLSVAKGGPKLAKSEGDPNGLPGLFFPRKAGGFDMFATRTWLTSPA